MQSYFCIIISSYNHFDGSAQIQSEDGLNRHRIEDCLSGNKGTEIRAEKI